MSTNRFSLFESMYAHLFQHSCFFPMGFSHMPACSVCRKHCDLQYKQFVYKSSSHIYNRDVMILYQHAIKS